MDPDHRVITRADCTILTRSTTLEAICQVCYSSLSYYTHKIYHIGSHLPGMLFITLILYSQDLPRWKPSARYAIHHSHTILTRSTTLEVICQVCYSSLSYYTHKIYHVGSHLPGTLFITLILYSQDLPHWKSSVRYAIHHSHTILTRSTTLEVICQVRYSSLSYYTHKIYHVGSHLPGTLFITLILYSQDLPRWKPSARYAIHHPHTILTRSTTLEAICQVRYSSLSYYKIYHVGSHLPGMLFVTLILYSQDLPLWKSSARYAIHHSHTILARSTMLEAICQVRYSSLSYYKIYHVGSHLPGMLFITLILYSQDLPRWKPSARYAIHHSHTMLARSTMLEVICQVCYSSLSYYTHKIYHVGSHLPGTLFITLILYSQDLPRWKPSARYAIHHSHTILARSTMLEVICQVCYSSLSYYTHKIYHVGSHLPGMLFITLILYSQDLPCWKSYARYAIHHSHTILARSTMLEVICQVCYSSLSYYTRKIYHVGSHLPGMLFITHTIILTRSTTLEFICQVC